MSIYDSTHSASGDSRATKRAKSILQKIIREQFKLKGFKVVDVKEEVPAFFDKPYHADLAVLVRSFVQLDFYSFFIVEIDSSLGHRTPLKDRRDDERAVRFIHHSGIRTVRFNLEEVIGSNKLSEFGIFDRIWTDAMMRYVIPRTQHDITLSDNNMSFAIRLKENAFTKCRGCDHPAAFHNLAGCDYKQTNKLKLRCHCNEPFFRSDA
jgi:hypothetical protein